jgi:phosphohistidine phosphatase
MEIHLVRHAIAEDRDPERWPDDALRPLTEDGERKFRKAARGLAAKFPVPDVVLASPFVRAWRTAELLHEEAGWPDPEPCRELEAGRSPKTAIQALARMSSRNVVAAVGHEPNLSELASLLLAGHDQAVSIRMKKGGAAGLQLEGRPRPASATLLWLMTPATLRSLG